MLKRWISVLLAVLLCVGLCCPAFAASADAEPIAETAEPAETLTADCPIIFVTGIGQTWTHLLNEDGSFQYNDRSKPWKFNFFYRPNKAYKLIEYNLFYPDSNALKNPHVLFSLVRAALQIVGSAVLRRNLVSQTDLETVLSAVFSRNIMDENGNLPPDVENCLKMYPLSEYSEIDRDNFYFSIPCESIVSQIGEENIYCFNHSAFDYFYADADALNTMIREYVLADKYNKLHASQVVLIPMSMGAGVVNAYLDKYGAQHDVKRVVSIVGAWDGTALLADLIEGKYAENAPELLYYGLPEMIGGIGGAVVSCLLRVFPKQVLRGIIDTCLSAFVQSIVLKAPSLVSMVPADRYAAIEQTYLQGAQWDKIRAETHRYQEAQKHLTERLTALEEGGMEFYFLCGYGMRFGDGDYGIFHVFRSAATTNSDEIIQIDSTAPGTTYAPAGQSLGKTGPYVSPDGSVDLSTSFAPDRTWCFYQQKHELEDNLTALRLALDISVGRVNSAAASATQYPQFGAARDLGSVSGWQKRLNAFVEEHEADPARSEDVAKAKEGLALCDKLLEETNTTAEADAKAMQQIREILDAIDPPAAPTAKEQREERIENFFNDLGAKWNEKLYERFGAKGFTDKTAA